ncbi:hypothetical protein [Agrobacterium fabrum]|uniref:hypothetical protein n=1 Tax=Agrobacterium fabrum TaxID=1176649 RepID=UPI002158137B|nr:hypothetical protein [Agrobacterium fabrum]MCR6722806.1 hypothetical protein [Agrobacterium fabrum]
MIGVQDIAIISVEPSAGRKFHRTTGDRILAIVEAFIKPLHITLRGLVLTHDEEAGYTIIAAPGQKAEKQWQFTPGTPFASALSEAAEQAYCSTVAEGLEELKLLYRNFK